MADLDVEVAVVGGGPAGATVAKRLAELGHTVCLIERSASAARRPGESLAPGILPILDALGVRDAVDRAGFLRPSSALLRWSDEVPQEQPRGAAPGFQVDRARFDRLLQDAAERAGARVLRPALVRKGPLPLRSGPAARWALSVAHEGREIRVMASFLCDASGRSAWLRGPRVRDTPPTVALTGYFRDFRGVRLGDTESRVEACDDAWLWGAPVPGGLWSAMVFVDPERLRGRVARSALYRQILARSTLLRGCLEGTLDGPVIVRDATPYIRRDAVGPGWIRVGEACFAIDPLSSQGVQAAMSSALKAAVVVHTMLSAPEHAGAAARFYRERVEESAAQHRGWATSIYAARRASLVSPFWQERAAGADAVVPGGVASPVVVTAGDRIVKAKGVAVDEVPCIEGDLVVPARAVVAPGHARPIAYLGDTPIVPLLELLTEGNTAREVLAAWSCHAPRERARAILGELLRLGVLSVDRPA